MIHTGSEGKALRDVGSLPPEPGEIIAGKYRIERVVGSGGMGIVVSARHLQLGQTVAIKLLRLNGLDPERQHEARARFLREGQAAATLVSDHVVRIHDLGMLESGAPFMVMELLRGDDLGTIIDRQGPAPIGATVDYILQACHAVSEAHSHGIVHRDLKPANLFVSIRSDGRATVKVLDFGISKAATGEGAFDGNLTDTRSVVGSPYYMSPEQVRDAKRVDARTDIWSLGMIMYELLAGQPAFHASTLPAICAAIVADTPRSIREERPEIPVELNAIVQKCLEKDPEKRFQSVSALMAALAPLALAGESAQSAAYASHREVMAPSEPFGRKVPPNALTLQPATVQGAPPPAVGEEAIVPADAPAEELSATSGSGSRLRMEYRGTQTLVSSSSSREPGVVGGTSTMVGSGGNAAAAEVTGTATPSPAISSSRRRQALIAAGVAIGVAIGAVWAGHTQTPPAPPVAAVAPRFTLRVESQPAGARVLDGDRVLGSTPYSVQLDPESGPRRLTLLLDGYERYAVEQPATDHDVQLLAVLKPVPAAPVAAPVVSATPAPSATAEHAPRPTAPRPHAVRPLPPPTAAKPTVPSDIRLER